MKRINIFLLLVIAFAGVALAQKKVAVYVTGDQDESIKKVLGSKMTSYITQSDDFTAVERTTDFLSAMAAEHDYQVSGEVSNSQIVKLGQQFGARYVAVVDVTEIYGDLFVSSRLIDVQTSQVTSSYEDSGSGGSLRAVTSLANNVADGLILLPERKKKEQNEKDERNRLANLRQQAISNLMPKDGIICGNYIVIDHKLPVKVIYNPNSENPREAFSLKIVGMPKGFEVVGDIMLEFLFKNYAGSSGPLASFNKYNKDYMRFHYVFMEVRERGTKNEKRIYTTSYINDRYHYTEKIGTMTRTKQGWDVWVNESVTFGAMVYREMFTEDEIQAEMNRISRGR